MKQTLKSFRGACLLFLTQLCVIHDSIFQASAQVVINKAGEQYSKLTQTENTASVSNYWKKTPDFTTEDLTYKCTNYKSWNSESLSFGQGETLQKIVDSYSYTGGLDHYLLFVSVQFWIIDVDTTSFKFYMTVGSNVLTYTKDASGLAFVNSPPNYCYNPSVNTCIDYCGQDLYDSLVQINSTILHTDSQITLTFSAALESTQLVGIFSTTMEVYTCDLSCKSCQYSSTTCTACNDSTNYIQVSTSKCVTSCVDTEYVYNDPTNSLYQNYCKSCSLLNCKTCPGDVCTKCIASYYFDSTACVPCNSTLKCATCSDDTQCDTCILGYYADIDGVCQKCSASCRYCDDAVTCNQCEPSYYLDKPSRTCKSCIANCVYCVDGVSCLNCDSSYLLTNDTNPICLASCGTTVYFKMSQRYMCLRLDTANCESPTNADGCLYSHCVSGYVKQYNYCWTSCGTSFYQESEDTSYLKCTACPTGCYTCDSAINCSSCNISYYRNDTTKICDSCIANCYSCTDGTTCQTCKSGYLLNDGLCVASCPSPRYSTGTKCLDCNITSCDQCANSYQCKTCATGLVPILNMCYVKCGYGMYREGTNADCFNCSKNCQDCTSEITCSSCESGYYLSLGYCKSCHSSCLTCNAAGANACQSCTSPSFLLGTRCVFACPDGYYSSGFEKCQVCTDSGCAICTAINQCSKCTDTSLYLVESSTCSATCPTGYSIYTNKNGYLACDSIVCSTGYYVSSSGTCLEICGDGQTHSSGCDDGNLVSGDGCSSTCTVESGFVCSNSLTAASVCRIIISYSLLQGEQDNILIIQFSQAINLLTPQILKISIASLKSSEYSYTITSVSGVGTQFQVTFSFLVQTSDSLQAIVSSSQDYGINFELKSNPSSNKYIMLAQTQVLTIKTSYEVSSSEKAISDGVTTATTVLQTAILTSIIPLTLSGSINFAASIIDISQLIQIHQFPSTLSLFFQVFQGFTFPFVTNFFTYMIPDDLEVNSYDSFTNNGVSAIYLSNMGQQYTILAIALISHGLLKLIGRKFKQINHKVDATFKYSVYHEVIMSTYLEIVFYTFIQWTNMTTNIAIEYINHIIMFFTFIVVFPVPFVAAYLIKKNEHSLENKEIEERFGSIWEGLNPRYICRIYYVFVHLRKVFFCLFIVFMNKAPQAQCVLILFPSLALIVIVAKTKPFKKRSENIKQLIQESCMIAGQIFILILQANSDSLETKRTSISWGVIVFFSIILVMHFFCTVLESYQAFGKQIIQTIQNYRNKSKVYDCNSALTKDSSKHGIIQRIKQQKKDFTNDLLQDYHGNQQNPSDTLSGRQSREAKSPKQSQFYKSQDAIQIPIVPLSGEEILSHLSNNNLSDKPSLLNQDSPVASIENHTNRVQLIEDENLSPKKIRLPESELSSRRELFEGQKSSTSQQLSPKEQNIDKSQQPIQQQQQTFKIDLKKKYLKKNSNREFEQMVELRKRSIEAILDLKNPTNDYNHQETQKSLVNVIPSNIFSFRTSEQFSPISSYSNPPLKIEEQEQQSLKDLSEKPNPVAQEPILENNFVPNPNQVKSLINNPISLAARPTKKVRRHKHMSVLVPETSLKASQDPTQNQENELQIKKTKPSEFSIFKLNK